MADGNPHNLLTILNDLSGLEADVLVSGHGPVGGPALQDHIRRCALTAGRHAKHAFLT